MTLMKKQCRRCASIMGYISFNTVARNWLAIHGNFDNFDFSLLTNSGIGKSKYQDFCYYSAGFLGDEKYGLTPKEQFKQSADFLTGKDTEKPAKAFQLQNTDRGTYAVFAKKFSKVKMQKAFDTLLSYFFNPNNTLISVTYSDGSASAQTIFHTVLEKYARGKKLEVRDILTLNLVKCVCSARTSQAYFVGNTFVSSLNEAEMQEVLQSAYECVLAVCSDDFLDSLADFPVLALNDGIGKSKAKTLKQFRKQLMVATCCNVTLNDLMHLFSYNIPDVLYSIKTFGTVASVTETGEFMSLTDDNKLMRQSDITLPLVDETISVELDTSDFISTFGSTSESVRRMQFD